VSIHRLYTGDGNPCPDFNRWIVRWLEETHAVAEHDRPAAFGTLRNAYREALEQLLAKAEPTPARWQAHRALLNNLTKMMMGLDISGEIAARLTSENINATGFRTTLSQGVAKNTGENFTNCIVYALADALAHQDRVLVDKGLPPALRPHLTLKREFTPGTDRAARKLTIPIEVDLAIFDRQDPRRAVIVSAKTRLKEVFHIGTMWKLLLDIIGDDYCLAKWGLQSGGPPDDVIYAFATADLIPPGGKGTQGPDVEREEVRNLIAVDASFFDYVFVSKQGIGHVANRLDVTSPREALFHELGCIFDLIGQHLGVDLI
jgi:hypothetical protein